MKTKKLSAGLLMYRLSGDQLEVFLAHPGGPIWQNKDAGAWTIPKGEPDDGEDLLLAAQREFKEETGLTAQGPFQELGTIKQKSGKVVHAWAFEGDADPTQTTCNEITMEWPKGSGKRITFPEVDRCEWFDLPAAREKLNPAQVDFLARLTESVGAESLKSEA